MFCTIASIFLAAVGCPDSDNQEYPNTMIEQSQDAQAITESSSHNAIESITEFFGTLVGTGPYPGVRSTYGGTDLMAQLSQINQDLDLLIGHDKTQKYFAEHNYAVKNPHLLLSGKMEGTGFVSIDPSGRPMSDIGLTGAELDILAAYKAITAFMVIQYQDFPSPVINNRIASENLFLDVAFVTIGDLNIFPMYTTIGRSFVPFGQYNSYNGFNDPLTEILFRTLADDATIGFYTNHLLGQFFFFKGNSRADSGNNINNFGVNLGTHLKTENTKILWQVSFMRNVADSLGMQLAFANSRNTNILSHVVPGINTNISVNIGEHWHFIGEYNTSLRSFAVADMGYSTNSGRTFSGARPQAFDIEGSYQFTISEKPTSISLGWSQTFEAVGFNLPRWRLDLTWATYIFKNTLLSLEFMHNRLYSKNDVATGQLAFGSGGSTPYYRLPRNKGHGDNTLTLDISFYW